MRMPSGRLFSSPQPSRWRPHWTGPFSVMPHMLVVFVVFVMLVMLALAACGQPTGIASGGAPGQATATATPLATALTGCPGATQPVSWPTPSAVVLTTPFPSDPSTLRAGQTLEVALPFGHAWQFQAGSEQPALALDSPAGYGDSSTQRCVWHFTAQQAGQVQLTFTMQALCPPHTNCPQYVMQIHTTITVTPAS